MYGTSEMIRAGRLTDCMTMEEYQEWLATKRAGNETFYSMFIVPGGSIEAGDVVIVKGNAVSRDNVDVPVVVGDWSPMVFRGEVAAPSSWEPVVSSEQVYISPIDGRDVVIK